MLGLDSPTSSGESGSTAGCGMNLHGIVTDRKVPAALLSLAVCYISNIRS